MQSWRKVGGINRSAKNQNIRAPRTVVTGDYYITKDNQVSGVQFADTTRQISAADTDNKGYWYDLSDDNVNIYRVDGSVNVGKKEPTFPAPYSDNQIFDPSLDITSNSFGKQNYDGSSPYQISYDGNMLVVGDYESQKIYTYIWNVDTFIWSKTITANEETNEINSINNPIQTNDDTYNNMHFGSNISFIKSSDANGQNSILVVSYPDQYLYTYVFLMTSAGLQWMPIKIKGGSNFYNYVVENIDDSDELPNWGASISIVGSGNKYFLTVGCPNTSGGGSTSNNNCGYIIYELNISFSDQIYTIINSDITKRSDHSQLGYSVSSFYQVDQSDSNQYTFRCVVGAPYYTKVDSSNSSSNPYCGCVNVSTINRFKSGSIYLKNGPTKIVVEPENPQNNANFGWSVSIDQTTGNYLAVGSPGVTSSNITTSNDSSNGFSSISKRNLSGLKARDDKSLSITVSDIKSNKNSPNPLAITVSSADNYHPDNPNDIGPSYQIFDTDNLVSGDTQEITFTAQKDQTVTGYLIGNGNRGEPWTKFNVEQGQGYPRGGSGGNGVGPYKGSFPVNKGDTFTVSFTYNDGKNGDVEWKDQNGTSLKKFQMRNSEDVKNQYGGLGGTGGVWVDGNNAYVASVNGTSADTTKNSAQSDLFSNIKVNPIDSNGNRFWTQDENDHDQPPSSFGGGGGGGQGQPGYNQYGQAALYGKGGVRSNVDQQAKTGSGLNPTAGGSGARGKKNYGAGGGGDRYNTADNWGGQGGPGAFILINEPLDTKAPVITISGNNPLTVAQGSSFTPPKATSDDGSTVTVESNTVNTLKIGNYSVVYTATDESGNTGTATLTVNVTDQTAPSAPQFVSFPNGNTESTVTIQLNDDATSWSYSVDNGSSFTAGSGITFDLITGTYNADTIQIKSKDNAGNESGVAKNTLTVVVNTNTPQLPTVTFPNATSNTGIVTVTLATNASYWAYSVDSGTTFNQGSGNQFTLGSATYAENQIRVKNMTNTGTESSTVNNTNKITVNTGVVGNPIVTWSVDDPLKYPTNKTEVKVTMGTGANSWSYSTDGSTFSSEKTTNGSFTLNEGTYDIGKVVIKNKNDVGTSSNTSNSYKITIDTTPPTVTLNGLTPQYVEKGSSWIDPSVTATDQSGIKSIQITGSVSSNTVGNYPITYTVTDNAGNVTSLQRIVIVQDTTAPALTVTPPTTNQDGITQLGQSQILTEPGTKVEVSSDGGKNFTTLTTNSSGNETQYYKPGAYNVGDLQTKVTDNAGNVATSANSSRIITVSNPSSGVITIAKGYYTSENVDGFETQLFVDNSIDILTTINASSPNFSVNQFYLERENDYNNNVKIYVENSNNKSYLTVTSDNLGDDAQELLLQNLTSDKNNATIFTVLDYNAFKIAANYRGYPDKFPVSKNQYWITTQIDNTLAVLAVNFKATDLDNKKRGVNNTTFDILTNSNAYNGVNRDNEAQSFYIDTGVFNSSSTDSDAGFGTVSLLTYNSSDGEYKENNSRIVNPVGGNLGYSVKSADNTVFVGYKERTQINIYKYVAGQLGNNPLQSIHNDNGQFSKYIVSDNSGLVLGSNYQHLNNDDTQYNRVILYNNRKPYNFYVTGESGVTGKFVVNNEAEINSLRVTSDMSNQDIDVRYGGNLLPFSVGALGNLTSNKLLMGVGLTDEGALENGYKINSIIEKHDSAIVYTDAWGKFNKNETSGLAICPGNYFNTAAGMRLDASGNVVVNGNLTVTGDLIVDGTETNVPNGGGNTPSGGGNTPSGGSNNFDPTGVITILMVMSVLELQHLLKN